VNVAIANRETDRSDRDEQEHISRARNALLDNRTFGASECDETRGDFNPYDGIARQVRGHRRLSESEFLNPNLGSLGAGPVRRSWALINAEYNHAACEFVSAQARTDVLKNDLAVRHSPMVLIRPIRDCTHGREWLHSSCSYGRQPKPAEAIDSPKKYQNYRVPWQIRRSTR
jgi:hypothetical protein